MLEANSGSATKRHRIHKMALSLLCLFAAASAASAAGAVTLPIEVVGAAGTISSAAVEVPAVSAPQVRYLWMQIHGLNHADMASVQVNNGSWVSLNNNTV